MSDSFVNRVVLITGASRGIGRAVALAFAREGALLVLAARSAEELARVQDEVRALGSEALSVPTDVTSPEAVTALVDAAVARFGRIDVLVNNAGIGKVGLVESAAFEDNVRQTMRASLFGMINVTQAVLPVLRRQGSGAIVNMSSVMGRKAFARFGSYAIVMHGVSAFSDSLRQEVAGGGIGVSVICPALTATDLLREAKEAEMPPPFRHMTPLSADEVARAVVAAVRQGKRRVVLPRMANMLLLGEALSPRIGDLIATALTKRRIARLLRMSSGKTYHETIAGHPAR
ncbi:NAD(P)-dependent dehydrogenase (short-subunit alcohol dehydrogenase family) [Streptomyces sp. SAI-135]|jgi:NAD(P)-dependent dehydrogenase (short-subunit alcohol dehydrogenase family)|uniref:SDR family NAD(P)-dependent oxidoreductase n=1 Tax=Streptomyces sp. SAI-218 TaxID=3377736 RepID=UPI00247CDFA8|nr:NAD(P)-dependent dehydrogenase (short-subunit alcohol dehydrogenase family) [Streptomyces sp. SAI-090]MDH6553970.1 NAD(P)-dependent dehydrogenase (short-subunit alcohol dehydrogenase family) [Streptomyces sp. SAI-041]MDH6573048.1 NAD(P)-dependent dehydrogenase (short-subunit alcohol dehydrogenase family) [Streptomyces sp. SAI-117]MDH6581990.1 NAD(P)-dependent dehydrogenase (short-subunit alcohol dehydrogenase family) [Streptomyces sp. SAI-133]MDH6614221.1 NAD(P)-dependent dehydrogenase (shor